MYPKFEAAFVPDSFSRLTEPVAPSSCSPELALFFDRFGGMSFKNGLYRVLGSVRGDADRLVAGAFADYAGSSTPFAYDWLGRIFAVDERRGGTILQIEPGSGEVYKIGHGLEEFHEQVLFEDAEETLALELYAEWRRVGGAIPSPEQCVGYKTPTYLGGQDDVTNLGTEFVKVYWHMSGQTLSHARKPGSRLAISA